MPKMGDAMEEGTLVRWLKDEGDDVAEGDAIAEIETDKVTLELESEHAGTLSELVASEGQNIPVGEAIAVVLGEGEEPPARRETAEKATEAAAESSGSEEGSVPTATEEPTAREESTVTPEPPQTNGRFRASPIVRRLARENDLDLSRISGTGPKGRIVERDVRAVLDRGEATTTEEATPAPRPAAVAETPPQPTSEPGTELRQPSRMQRVVGERMQQSKREAPHFYATVEVRMDEAMALRKRLNEALAEQEIKLSVNDLVMKSCAIVIKSLPKISSLYTSEGIELHEQVNMAMAVALEEGLITPVIRDAANKELSAISAEAKDLAKRARDGQLRPDEYQGGTFTVSNMGMFGVEDFAAIINPPQAAIVAVSTITKRPIYDENDELTPANLMKITLSADHRVVNGAEGAQYLAEVKRLLENPLLVLV
jgi:pyruvate dehydrogenase E2 component (dihydrolipoamide acetyltransferase)